MVARGVEQKRFSRVRQREMDAADAEHVIAHVVRRFQLAIEV